MTVHSSILAWEIPWTEESGGLQSMGSQKSQTRLKRLSGSKSNYYLPWGFPGGTSGKEPT